MGEILTAKCSQLKLPNLGKGASTSAFSRVATLNPLGDDLFDGEDDDDTDEDEEEVSKKGSSSRRKQRDEDKSAEAKTPKTGGHQMLRRQDQRYKEIKRQLARRAKARREDKSAIEE